MVADSHAHLYWDSYRDNLPEVLRQARDGGVGLIINIGVDLKTSDIVVKQQIKELEVFGSIGIHPHEAIKYLDTKNASIDVSIHKDIVELEQLYQLTLSNPTKTATKIVAIGECGLDFLFPDPLPSSVSPDQVGVSLEMAQEMQCKLFKAQVELAKKLNLPLIVHCRDDRSQDSQNSQAWDEVLEIVGSHPAILHCYSGLTPTTNYILQTTNLLVSFAANITYPKNDYLREAAFKLPLEKIIVETDSPFLSPQNKRGQTNEPAAVLEVAKVIAQIKKVSLAEVEKQTTANLKKILNLS